jgi:hypothetical protein
VKVALSIICSLAFAWAQVAVCAQMPQLPTAKADCGCGGKMACCAAHSAPVSQPLAANPVPGFCLTPQSLNFLPLCQPRL